MSVEFDSPKSTPWQQHHYHQRQQANVNSNQSSGSLKKKSKYKLLQEQDLLKAARDGGFVQALSELDLLENSQTTSNKKPRSPGQVRLLNLQNRRLQDISIVDLCERLEICNLSNNFIYDIEPLKWCRNLFCLDVHSNQVSSKNNFCTLWCVCVGGGHIYWKQYHPSNDETFANLCSLAKILIKRYNNFNEVLGDYLY